MTWLLTQMWAYMAASGLLALLLGWGLRGAILKRRLRTAEVDAGLAKTELEQARLEIEGLYAAQRKLTLGVPVPAPAMPAMPAPDADSAAKEARIAELTSDLVARRVEIDSLRKQLDDLSARQQEATTATRSAPASSAADLAPDVDAKAFANLEWRNRYLESRLRTLEERQAAAAGPTLVPAPVETSGDSADAGTSVELAKLRWQADYLKTRLKVFEERAGVQLSGEPPAGPEEVPETPVTPTPSASARTDSDPDRETPDEELARLRWRNRYLEGRLAYLEEERSKEPVAPVERPVAPFAVDLPAASAEPEPAPEPSLGPAMAEPAAEPVTLTAPLEPAPAPQMETHVEPSAEPAPSEVSNAAMTAQPPALDKPRNGTPDDLTLIEGIGPRIQDVLNSLGVYHFDQIAAWTPENESWIDDYLSFAGRVSRERWVDQARALAQGE